MKAGVLAMVLVACGGGGNDPDPDSAVPDDGPSDPGRVDVTVFKVDATGDIDATAIVIFYDQDDAIVSHGSVNAVGQAFGFLPDGGSVTVLRELPGESALDHVHALATMRNVKPGDNLVFDRRREEQATGAMDTMVANYTPFDNDGVSMIKPCNGTPFVAGKPVPLGTPSSKILQFYEGCTTPTFDMLVLSQGTNRQFIWMPDVPYVGGGSVTVPDTWQPMQTLTTSFANLPAGDSLVGVFVSTLVGPMQVEMNRGQFTLNPASSSVSHQWPPGAGRGAVVLASPNAAQNLDQHLVFTPGSPSAVSIDFAALPLPRPGRPVQMADSLAWTETGAPAGDLRFAGWIAELTDTERHRFFWTEMSDATVPRTSTTLLPLPDEYAASDPTRAPPGTLALQGSFVQYLDYDNLDPDSARLLGQRLADTPRGYRDGALHVHTVFSP